MSNKIKNEQLGMPYGTARNRLIKSIMFAKVNEQSIKVIPSNINIKSYTLGLLSLQ